MKHTIKLGLIAGALSGSALILEQYYIVDENMPSGIYAFLFAMFNLIAFAYAAIYSESKNNHNFQIPFNLGIKEGIKVGAMMGICVGLATILFTQVLEPQHIQDIADQGRVDNVEGGTDTNEEFDDYEETYSGFQSWPMKLITQVVLYIVASVFYSMFITYMVRNMPIHDQDQT